MNYKGIHRNCPVLKTLIKPFLSVLILSCFSSCIHYEAKKINRSQVFTQFSERSLSDDGLKSFLNHNSVSSQNWKKAIWGLNDLTLAALYFNPELDVARASWKVEQSVEEKAKEFNGPDISLTPGFNSSNSIPSPWIFTSLIQFTYETAGKHEIRVDFAHNLSEAARLHIVEVAWQIRSQLRREMVNVYIAAQKETVLRFQIKFQKEQLEQIKELYNDGKISAYEISQFKILLSQTHLALNEVQIKASSARLRLAAAIGVNGKALRNIRFSFNELFETSLQNPQEERNKALLNRADILKALSEYAASEDSLRMAVAKQYPDIQLGPGYQYDQGENKWRLSLDATTPLFSRNKGDIHEAEMRRTLAAAQFNALQIKVLQNLDQSETAYKAKIQKRTMAAELEKNCQQRLTNFKKLLNEGKITLNDLFQAQREVNNAELLNVEVLYETQQSLCDLEDAIQYPLSFNEVVYLNPVKKLPNSQRNNK